jgi:hypothetical protein
MDFNNYVNYMKTISENVKTVTFSPNVTVFTDSNLTLKIYDGASTDSIIYTDILYHFMLSPRSVNMAERKKNIYDNLYTVPSISSKYLKEAENTLEKLNDPNIGNVPLWSKGCSYKKASISFPPNNKQSSIIWIKLFINYLRKIDSCT